MAGTSRPSAGTTQRAPTRAAWVAFAVLSALALSMHAVDATAASAKQSVTATPEPSLPSTTAAAPTPSATATGSETATPRRVCRRTTKPVDRARTDAPATNSPSAEVTPVPHTSEPTETPAPDQTRAPTPKPTPSKPTDTPAKQTPVATTKAPVTATPDDQPSSTKPPTSLTTAPSTSPHATPEPETGDEATDPAPSVVPTPEPTATSTAVPIDDAPVPPTRRPMPTHRPTPTRFRPSPVPTSKTPDATITLPTVEPTEEPIDDATETPTRRPWPSPRPTAAPASKDPDAVPIQRPTARPTDRPVVIRTQRPTTTTPASGSSTGDESDAGHTTRAPPASTPAIGSSAPATTSPAAVPPPAATRAPIEPLPTTKRPSNGSIGWDLIKDLITNKWTRAPHTALPTTAPGPADADKPGKVVEPSVVPDKVHPPTTTVNDSSSASPKPPSATVPSNATAVPGAGAATAVSSAPPTPVATTEAKTPAPTKKANKTVNALEDTDDDDETTDAKAQSFKVVEKTTITVTDGGTKQTFQKYDRNIKTEKKASSTSMTKPAAGETATEDEVASASSSYGNVIGGNNREHPPPGADIAVSAFAAKTQNAIRYSSYAFTLVSFGLLVFFHVLALTSPRWLVASASARRLATSSWLLPTTWELVAVGTYYQHLGSVSMLELTKAPYLLLDFTDAFSWANFHLHAIVTATTRRLQFIILTGIVSYSDRLGIDEGAVLAHTTRFVLLLTAVVLALFGIVAVVTHVTSRQSASRSSSADSEASKRPAWTRSIAVCILGAGVALWLLSVFPLTTVSTYELTMQIRYQVSGEIVVALANMALVVVATLCLLFYKVRSIRAAEAFQYYAHGVYGTLYADMKQNFRYFFVTLVLFQATVGVLTGGIQDVPDQLIALLVVHVVFCAVLIYLAPFADKRVQWFIAVLFVVRIVNLSIAFAFLTVSELETASRGTIAHAFVLVNFVVVVALFGRHVAMFIATLRKWSQNSVQLSGDNDGDASRNDQSMLAHDVHDSETPSTDVRLTATMSVVRGPNNSMHC